MLYITALIYGKNKIKGEFKEYESKTLAIFKQHGGEIENDERLEVYAQILSKVSQLPVHKAFPSGLTPRHETRFSWLRSFIEI